MSMNCPEILLKVIFTLVQKLLLIKAKGRKISSVLQFIVVITELVNQVFVSELASNLIFKLIAT